MKEGRTRGTAIDRIRSRESVQAISWESPVLERSMEMSEI